jgi:hypothetical protein
MVLLGLLLLLATSAFTIIAIVENFSGGPDYMVMMFGNHIATLNGLGLFLSGIALALIFCLSLAMISGGATRYRRTRAGLRSARRDAAQATAERDALAAQINHGETGEAGTPAGESHATASPESERAPRRHRGRHIFGH